jgi:hypothetical protein
MEDAKKQVVELLKSKAILKQEVYHNTIKWFDVFKKEIKQCVADIRKELGENANKIRLKLKEASVNEVQLFIGSDVIIFQMHTNVFKIASDNYVHQSSYIRSNPNNAFCGIINVYNFLADSYEFNRFHDYGYLISRVFINRESHFFVEGKGQLEFVYKDFLNQTLTQKAVEDIVLKVSAYAIDFDLLTPPYDKVAVVTVDELLSKTNETKIKTGKRLGFKFKSDNDFIG